MVHNMLEKNNWFLGRGTTYLTNCRYYLIHLFKVVPSISLGSTSSD